MSNLKTPPKYFCSLEKHLHERRIIEFRHLQPKVNVTLGWLAKLSDTALKKVEEIICLAIETPPRVVETQCIVSELCLVNKVSTSKRSRMIMSRCEKLYKAVLSEESRRSKSAFSMFNLFLIYIIQNRNSVASFFLDFNFE